MTANAIRTKFLGFFKSKGHTVVASDSLVPKDDPTVLFTTAGMQQFKPQFMGHLTGFSCAASSQKCLRTDDLAEVGVTDFHHTFFEMLGNFSFGDYFKREAISWAWEFLTKVLGLAPEKLWVSVNRDDQEAYDIWLKETRIPADRIVRLGDKSNFWPSNARLNGPNGPCGPCSEIFYDWGNADCKDPDCGPDCSCGRFCEVWNLVFTQYNRKDNGILEPLPARNIDTGMGLERLTAVMQGKRNNFETDLFQPIILAVDKAVTAEGRTLTLKEKRVIADHIRAVTVGLADGVVPSNEGRGYVMRRLIVDMSNILIQAGVKKPLVYTFVSVFVNVMKEPYPELAEKEKEVSAAIKRVEEAVIRLNAEKLPEFIAELKRSPLDPKLIGEIMFRYRDTYGLSEETVVASAANTVGVDVSSLAKPFLDGLMNEQKERSRAASKMQGDVFLGGDVDVKGLPKTVFVGYEQPCADTKVLKIFVNGVPVDEVREGSAVFIVLDKTPFYAEQGGQVTDTGSLAGGGQVEVMDVRRINDVIVHKGRVIKGVLKAGETVSAAIDGERRMAITRNHTATHLLQAGLRQVLGGHVQQQGSLVDENRMRFDFTHPRAVTRSELDTIEDVVNAFVRRCDPVVKKDMTIEEAKKSGALAFFAEKYGETVRVVSVGEYSREFCGGTHLDCAGQIGVFKIVSESAVAQGIRRIEAVTGTGALDYIRRKEQAMDKAAAVLKSPVDELVARVEQQVRKVKDLQRQVAGQRFELIKNEVPGIIAAAQNIRGAVLVARIFRDINMETIRSVSDMIRLKCSSVAQVLGAVTAEDAALIVSVSDDLVQKGIKANDVIRKVAPLMGGSGGGRPQMAQAGTKNTNQLDAAVEEAGKIIGEALKA